MDDFATARMRMVDSQLRTEDVSDYHLLAAMGEIPRERFVPPRLVPLAYLDEDLPLSEAEPRGPARFLMRPATFARLVQLAAVVPTDTVLDVGCATGYSTAVLARLARSVVGLESDARLADLAAKTLGALGVGNARIVANPLEAGYEPGGPYDLIIVEGSAEVIPELLLGQIAENGRLVAVIGSGREAQATIFTRSDGDIGGHPAFDAFARALPGFRRPMAFVF